MLEESTGGELSGIRRRRAGTALPDALLGTRSLVHARRSSRGCVARGVTGRIQHAPSFGAPVPALLIENRIDPAGRRGSASGRRRDGDHTAVSGNTPTWVVRIDARDEHDRRHQRTFRKHSQDALDRPRHVPHSRREPSPLQTKFRPPGCQRKNSAMSGPRSLDNTLCGRPLRNTYIHRARPAAITLPRPASRSRSPCPTRKRNRSRIGRPTHRRFDSIRRARWTVHAP
jgi:hypothetical protein